MQSPWNTTNINILKQHYPTKGKEWCCKRMGLKECRVRYKAAQLGLRLDWSSPHHQKIAIARGLKIRGRKRPEHSLLMKQYSSEGRLYRAPITKIVPCTNCGKNFSPTRDRGHASFRCCSIICSKERQRRAWPAGSHPRGMLGKTHSPETRKVMSARYKAAWADPKSKLNSKERRQNISDRNMERHKSKTFYKNVTNPYSRCKAGWWESAGKRYYMRSAWEHNYAWYLEWLKARGDIKDWEYEVDTFWFEAIERGVRSYTPDFKVFAADDSFEYHEVKGWMDAKSKTKLKRMVKYHPSVTVVLVDEQAYKSIAKWSRLIPGWE